MILACTLLIHRHLASLHSTTPLPKLCLGRDVCRRMASSSSRVKKARDGIFRHRRAATSAPFSLCHYFIAVERMNSLMHPLGDHPTLSLPRRSDDCRALLHVSRVSSIQYLHMGANNLCLNTSAVNFAMLLNHTAPNVDINY